MERLARWMIENGFATGHGDNAADLLSELSFQIAEIRDRRDGLDAALRQLVYWDSDRQQWRTGIHGDHDVTAWVGHVLDKP